MTQRSFQLPQSPLVWVFAGDSITQGVLHTYGARCWVEHLHERLRWQLDRFLDTIINSGMSGWSAPEVLEKFDHLIGRYSPQVVSLSLGTNDCLQGDAGLPEFKSAMLALVEKSQQLGATVILQTPALVTSSAPPTRRQFLPIYANAVRELAARQGCPLVDHEAHWKVKFGAQDPIAWMDDHTHPNAVGHANMAQLILETLGIGRLSDIHVQ
ncbi:SGNH/GDSL hydrolase family protein [Paucibacter sp. AS339]|uniref:SGNH/GDSL hydrolase family protein n=1 Tax=Paucibacter hankyongi TaxID=3133434 RepID=UPI0030B0C27F